jgi:hypothetical protein
MTDRDEAATATLARQACSRQLSRGQHSPRRKRSAGSRRHSPRQDLKRSRVASGLRQKKVSEGHPHAAFIRTPLTRLLAQHSNLQTSTACDFGLRLC